MSHHALSAIHSMLPLGNSDALRLVQQLVLLLSNLLSEEVQKLFVMQAHRAQRAAAGRAGQAELAHFRGRAPRQPQQGAERQHAGLRCQGQRGRCRLLRPCASSIALCQPAGAGPPPGISQHPIVF